MPLAIVGLGTALPDYALSQEQAARVMQTLLADESKARLVPILFRQAGLQRRHLVRFSDEIVNALLAGGSGPTTRERMQAYVGEAAPLALRSAQGALQESGLGPADITHLVTVSCTGFAAPGVDIALIEQLGLAPTVQRTHVGFMGCHGAINGLRVAQAFADADPAARVLVCAFELCSLHLTACADPGQLVACALFADGAAALVGVPAAGDAAGHWKVAASGSCLIPGSQDAMTWTIGDHGFVMTLAAQVPHLIETHLRGWLQSWLAANGLKLTDIASWAIHPGGPRILSAVSQCLGLAPQATAVSRAVLARCGNMSSPTVLFIVDELRRSRQPLPCVALGFGPGMVAEAVLLR